MGDYTLTPEKLHAALIKNEVYLRRSDIERIVDRIQEKYTDLSEILRFQRASEMACRYERMMIQPLRAAKACCGSWDGVERRVG